MTYKATYIENRKYVIFLLPTFYIFSNQSNVTTQNETNRVRLSSAVNATDCDCSYHSKKNRAAKSANDDDTDDEDEDSDIDDA